MITTELFASFLSLTALEIVLGVDNIVFIAIVVAHLPDNQRDKARIIGLVLAMVTRIILLFGVAYILKFDTPLLTLFGVELSLKDILTILGGLFLIYKGTSNIHEELNKHENPDAQKYQGGFRSTILQIIALDVVFSFDSIATAIGLTDNLWVIVAAFIVAMTVMLIFSGTVAEYVRLNPTIKMLALAFVMLIGFVLVSEGFGVHVPKGYIYFAMAFSLAVELLNIEVKKRKLANPK